MTEYEWGTMTDMGAVMFAVSEQYAREQSAEWGDTLVRREVGPWEPVPSEAGQVALAPVETRKPVPDLMAALEASLAAAHAAKDAREKGRR